MTSRTEQPGEDVILGIETAYEPLSVALAAESGIIGSIAVLRSRAHDALLVSFIERLLEDAGVQRSRIKAVAVSAGPGSFTGLRIGMAAAKGFAFACGVPLIAVPTFEGMARQVAFDGIAAGQVFAPVCEARREQCYTGLYTLLNNGFVQQVSPHILPYTALAEKLPEGALIAGNGARKLDALKPGAFRVIFDYLPFPSAEGIAAQGWEMLWQGQIADLASCEPMYLAEFQTTMPK